MTGESTRRGELRSATSAEVVIHKGRPCASKPAGRSGCRFQLLRTDLADNSRAERKKLWRYMPLVALLDFLQTAELRLPRVDSFEDVREGHVGLEAMLETVPSRLHSQATEALKKQNKECFVSCWHLSSSESLAMWKVYGVHNFSVAMVSNVGKVMSACQRSCQ